MNITIAIVVFAALLSVVSTTVLISLGPEANAQGGCPTSINPNGHNCQNPHEIFGGPVPSCASPLAVGKGGSDPCRVNPSSP
jgi:hypothetical protein